MSAPDITATVAARELALAVVEQDVHRRLERGNHRRQDVDRVREVVDRHASTMLPVIYPYGALTRDVLQQLALDVVRDLTDG